MNEFNDSTTSAARAASVGLGDHGLNKNYSSQEGVDISEQVPEASRVQKIAMLIAVIGPFLGCIVAIAICWQYGFMGWQYLAMVIAGWALTTLGITVGFHRLLAHKSFETYRWVKATLMMLGALSVEGAPLVWCAVHRRHHGHSDQEGDPHSPNLAGHGFKGMIKGLWHGQIGWLFSGYWSKPNFEKYIPDLTKDRLLRWIDKNYYLFVILSLVGPAALGYAIEAYLGVRNPWYGAGLGFLWGGLVRIFLTHHVTWSINSVCHVFGKRHFRSGDHSTNNAVCAMLSMGEGWHNNHHAFPSSARHGLFWYQFDMSWIVIRTMQMVGLAWDVKLPSKRALEARRIH
ncbi:MAG: fatty acid desaturase [Pirellulaceae bacterium]|jgi:stearoyl-CoA desaturase (Delta-9 desaturase)|nr:fatty acid desaturase [Pirellulaceae bacterium]